MIYLVHELARRVPPGIEVFSFDPGMMPGTGLAREGAAIERAMWHSTMHLMKVLPNVTSPASAGRSLAVLVTGPAPTDSGGYVELDQVLKPSPESYDPAREADLWTEAAALVGLRDNASPPPRPPDSLLWVVALASQDEPTRQRLTAGYD